MAASVLTVTVTDNDATQDSIVIRGTIAWAAGDYSTAGNTLDFSGLDQVKSNSVPKRVFVYSVATAGPTNLFVYHYAPGTTIANGKLQLFTGAAAQTALTEFSAGAAPAGVTGDTIGFEAVFPKLT